MNASTRTILQVIAALAVIAALGWAYKSYNDSDDEYDEEYDEEYDNEEDSDAEFDAESDDAEFDAEYDGEYDAEAEISRPLATSAALLPKPTAKTADFAQYAPKNLGAQNFLSATQFIGLNTQGASLKNANYDLRAAPVIPKKKVGPWLMSSVEPDLYQRPLV